jgi:hypothetical protein
MKVPVKVPVKAPVKVFNFGGKIIAEELVYEQ